MAESAVERPMPPTVPLDVDLNKKVWGAEPDTLLRELINVITQGIRDAASELLCSYSSFPDAPAPDTIKQLLNVLLQRIQPVLQQELAHLSRKAKKDVFSLPPKTDVSKLITVIENARSLQDTQKESRLDMEIAAVRAQMRDCGMKVRQLSNLKETASRQVELLQNLERNGVSAGGVKEVSERVLEAERDFVSSVKILSENGGVEGGNSLLKAAAEAVGDCMDEHAPLQTFLPEARSILKDTNGGDDLAGLRQRLLG